MVEAWKLLQEAEKRRRLAAAMTDERTRTALLQLAAEYEAHALRSAPEKEPKR